MKRENLQRICRDHPEWIRGQYHVFLGTTDVWLSIRQLERLHDEVRKQLAE